MTNAHKKAPAGNGGNLDKLIKHDDLSILPGYPDGLQAALAYAPEDWKTAAISEGVRLARTGEPFTIETILRGVRGRCEIPYTHGAIMSYLRNRELVECIGWTSHRTGPHAVNGIRVWRGTAKAKTYEIPGAGGA